MANGERIKFGPFEANLRTCELFRRGSKVPIQQKPFQLLAILLHRSGDLVTREEIQQLLWPDTYVQKELSLNTAVRKLRLALGDKEHTRHYIETVGSRGYRFSQSVTISGVPDSFRAPVSVRRIRLAVLPLENVSGPEHEAFSDGLTEQLIACLGRVGEHVNVIAPVSSMQYKRTSKSTVQICSELRCDHILSGSVLRVGNRIRVTAKLIRASDQACAWTDSFSSDQLDVLALQDEIAAQITQALRSVFPNGTHQSKPLAGVHPDLMAKYLRATAFAGQAFEAGFENAARLLHEVLEAAPDFALAHADLAKLLANSATFGIMPVSVLFREVQEHARAALAISDNLESAHIALGYMHFYYEADWDEAERAFRRAVQINPSCVPAYMGLSQVMTASGMVDQGIDFMRHAHDLDPISPIVNTMLACAHYFAGQHEHAERVLAEGLALHPGFPIALVTLSWVKLATGRPAEAVAPAQEARERSGDSPLIAASLSYVLACAGQVRKARTTLTRLRESPHVPTYWLALCHLALNESDAALDLLETCMHERCAWRVLMLVDPKVKALAEHPRYRAMVDQLNFPDAAAAGQ